MTPAKPQGELFQAETQWFHFFRSMIDGGGLAEMTGSSLKVYLVIKAHSNYHTGDAFPSHETIAELSGLSVSQVKRLIKDLVSFGYISSSLIGRSSHYRIHETVQIQDESGSNTHKATWDYKPSTVRDAVADLKDALRTRDIGNASVVHIERLQVNVNHVASGGVVFNLQATLDQIQPGLREQLVVLLKNVGAIAPGTYTQPTGDTDHP